MIKLINIILCVAMIDALLTREVQSDSPRTCYDKAPFDELEFPALNGRYWNYTTQTLRSCERNYCNTTTFSDSNPPLSVDSDDKTQKASTTLNVLQIQWTGLLDCFDQEAKQEILNGAPGFESFFKVIAKMDAAKILRLFINGRHTLLKDLFCDFFGGIVENFLDVSLEWGQPEIESLNKALLILYQRNLEAEGNNQTLLTNSSIIKPGLLDRYINLILKAISVPSNQRGIIIEEAFEANKRVFEKVIEYFFANISLRVVNEEDNIFAIAWPIKGRSDSAEDSLCQYITARILQSETMMHVVRVSTTVEDSRFCLLDAKIDPEVKKEHRKLLGGFRLKSASSPSPYSSQEAQTDGARECPSSDILQEGGTEQQASQLSVDTPKVTLFNELALASDEPEQQASQLSVDTPKVTLFNELALASDEPGPLAEIQDRECDEPQLSVLEGGNDERESNTLILQAEGS